MLKLNNRARTITVLAAGCIVLAACTEPTPYAPAVERFGYTDNPIEENRFRVSFGGNSRTPRATVETYLLYRAAEVTVAEGFDWFRIADQETEVTTRFRSFSNSGFGFGSPFFRRGFRSRFGSGFGSTTTRPISRYDTIANIVVFEGDKPAEDPQAYDARSVLQTLGPTIVRPEERDG
ncbi:MAG: hypothetical protein AAGE80_01060 [Pseudomonadota bacterium]